jgi:hypothetical protein
VERLNVSGGIEVCPLRTNAHTEIMRRGAVYIGVWNALAVSMSRGRFRAPEKPPKERVLPICIPEHVPCYSDAVDGIFGTHRLLATATTRPSEPSPTASYNEDVA